MDGQELSELMEQRWTTLNQLLEISQRQIAAIEAGRMSELMRVLSEKQSPLNQLSEIADRIREAAADDPEQRMWDSPQRRQRCAAQQEECERMHLELLAIEAQCESALSASRDEIKQKLERVDAGRQAASSYAESQSQMPSGGQLDLSSD